MIFDTDVLVQILTTRRLEIIRTINSFKPKSINKLAELTKRKKQAVCRDLKILERYDLVAYEKNGREISPRMKRKMALLNLGELYAIDSSGNSDKEIKAQVFVDNKKINKSIKA